MMVFLCSPNGLLAWKATQQATAAFVDLCSCAHGPHASDSCLSSCWAVSAAVLFDR